MMKKNRLLNLAIIFLAGPFSNAIAGPDINFVPVGNPGNPADTNGIGSVAFDYEISKYEITNDEYVVFLNAVAATDPAGLYNSLMGTEPRGGITQSGTSGSYSYASRSNMGNKPVNFLSFWDRCRFCNWMHNGCPTGNQSAATTEDGAYDLTDGNAITNNTVTRKPGATYFIPSKDEWHKAAYYDPRPEAEGGPTGDDNYWRYPTQSDSVPTPATATPVGDVANPGSNVANYSSSANWNAQSGNVTSVGTAGAASYYGLYDLGGNVWDVVDFIVGPYRQIRGGAWSSPNRMASTETDGNNLMGVTTENDKQGFRIARLSIPKKQDIEFVTVGDPNNPADANSLGSVDREYRISKYEITNNEYAVFLNAVAATDPAGLYNSLMGSDPRGGISQIGESGSYLYAVRSNMGNKPVNFLSFWDRCRFCNWLHNDCPTGAQSAATTEDGAYDLTDENAITGNTVTREPDAKFFIPNEDEWYKAAYYDPRSAAQGGPTGDDNYWLYPTQSDTPPAEATVNASGDVTNPGSNVANHNLSSDWNGVDGNVSTVGSTGSTSYYGAFDMGGNLFEQNETIRSIYRVLRGGAWHIFEDRMRSTQSHIATPLGEVSRQGMRIAAIPAATPPVDNSALKAKLKRQLKGLSKQLKKAKRTKKKSKAKKIGRKIKVLKRRLGSL